MPLRRGTGSQTIRENIRELRRAGFPERQSVAIAMNKAGKGKPKPRPKPPRY